ncbi:TetR family transcriptional regulator [Actinomadura harenae]|uniref:TetR/AcrR family transcriptional regulator n=1 Tax=Actinomadura harenae TaxID=2483351 RepID=A0A3M2M9G2_9ACTN|nr:TetR family transcriptional regulator [Actinomadura harenae]RMI46101.1 TetR/AcrR family transcriptional regulator [Actinomadura harenae]
MAYDSTATKERILAAATSEFAAYGIAGARVDRIAAQAQANKRAIYDYFGDKDKLFAAVLERLMTDLAQAVPPGDDDLSAYAERLFDHHRAHPEALRMLMWEALELGDQPVPGEEPRTRHYEDKVRAMQAEDGDDSRTRLFLALGLVGWSLALPQVRRMILGADHGLDEMRADVVRAVRALPGGGENPEG